MDYLINLLAVITMIVPPILLAHLIGWISFQQKNKYSLNEVFITKIREIVGQRKAGIFRVKFDHKKAILVLADDRFVVVGNDANELLNSNYSDIKMVKQIIFNEGVDVHMNSNSVINIRFKDFYSPQLFEARLLQNVYSMSQSFSEGREGAQAVTSINAGILYNQIIADAQTTLKKYFASNGVTNNINIINPSKLFLSPYTFGE